MKVKLLVSMCGANFSYHAGEEMDVSNEEALSIIDAGFAEAKSKKEFESLRATIEKEKEEAIEKEKAVEAILYKTALEEEKKNLETRILEIDAILGREGK